MDNTCLHATAIEKNGRAVLLCGASGSGKSDLALRLIRLHGYRLVSDDQVILQKNSENKIIAHAPENIRGLLEVRGIGIVEMPYMTEAPLCLIIEFGDERLPDPDYVDILDRKIKRIVLDPFETSVAEKLNLALEVIDK